MAEITMRLPKDSIQSCVSQKGKTFNCYFDQGNCFSAKPLSLIQDYTKFRLKPCKGVPLILSAQQNNDIQVAKQGRNHQLNECRKLQRSYILGNESQHAESNLWKLVNCLKIEADLEYDPETGKTLYQKMISLLQLLIKYPSSKIKANLELATIHETYFQNYGVAYEHYLKVPLSEFPYVTVSLGKTACLQKKTFTNKIGLKHYLSAIENGILKIDINNLDSQAVHLNHILENCGYENLIPILDKERTVLAKDKKRDFKNTLKFIRRHL